MSGSSDTYLQVKFVGSIKCQSVVGCDWPEAVEAALQYANRSV